MAKGNEQATGLDIRVAGVRSSPVSSTHDTLKLPRMSKLLVVFIHGFLSDDKTFLEFPEKVKISLREKIAPVLVESLVYPTYGVCSLLIPRHCQCILIFTLVYRR